MDLTTGAFPSSYGDRMGGILDLSTISPSKLRTFRLSLSILSVQLEGNGTLGEKASWLASVRRGTTDLAGRLFGKEDPTFWDVFLKLDSRLTSSQSARVNFLHSGDELDLKRRKTGDHTAFNTNTTTPTRGSLTRRS